MEGKNPTREQLIEQDVADLQRLGYAQQLFREMGGFSNFAVSFSIISVLTGAVLLYGYGLKLAGPVINSVGWPVVSLFTLAVAASMAELASAYPTAGGLYFWAFRLGGRTWAWVTAWLNMIGQVTITAGINVAAATYLPFLWRPETHMFLKPEVTKDFALRVGHRFAADYEARLETTVYESLLDLVSRTAAELADLKPRDRIDVQSFIWVIGSYKEENEEQQP